MKKQLHKLLLVVAAFIATTGTYAQSVEVDGIYYKLDNRNKTASVTSKPDTSGENAYSGDLVIPSQIETGGVTFLVKFIEEKTFMNCTGLTSVSISESVENIGFLAFADCSNLTSIEVAAENDFYCSIDGVVFNKRKTEITTYPAGRSGNYEIPPTVINIAAGAFYSCSGLTSVSIPNSVEGIRAYAFMNCANLASIYMESPQPPAIG